MPENSSNSGTVKVFGTIGGLLAVVASYWVNHSIGWAILHFFCGWLYIIYWIFARGAEVIPNWPF